MSPSQVAHKIRVSFMGRRKPPKEKSHRILKELIIDYDKT